MPPPQRLLSTRLRGFVCKSCLSKLQAPRRQQSPRAARAYATNDKPRRRKGGPDVPHGAVRFFEQTPDGVRTELEDEDDNDEAFTESVTRHLKEIERKTGRTMHELSPEDIETILRGTIADSQGGTAFEAPFEMPSLGTQDPAETAKILEAMAAQDQELQAQMDFIDSFDLKNMSEDDRVRLREELLGSVKKDTSPERQILNQSKSKLQEEDRRDGEYSLPISAFPFAYRERLRALDICVNSTSAGKEVKRTRRRRSKPEKPISDSMAKMRETWRAYKLCRRALISAPQLVPQKFWAELWNILEREDIDNLNRMSHLKTLGDDMKIAGAHMSQSQRLLHIEATFIEADQGAAIKAWEWMGLDSSHTTREYWELGVRMFCRRGLVDRAFSCVENILQSFQDPDDFRLLLPIIGTTLRSGDETSLQLAWALYIRLRFNLADKITMEDYDSLVSMFMETNHQEQAFAVFKDMMLTADTMRADADSISRYKSTVGSSAVLGSMEISSQELVWQDFSIMDKIQSYFDNPIFFASWIKKLIGDGELESAEKVYYLMQERGVRPSSISINGLIGAWYRKGNEHYRQKADELAWHMIRERHKVVALREQNYDKKALDNSIRLVRGPDKPDSKPVTLVPFATIETFSILLQQYRMRRKFHLIPDLFDALQKARIKPNADFMNQLLLTELKANSVQWAIETYRSLTDPKRSKGSVVRPNFRTYEILWEILVRAYDPIAALPKESKQALPQPRRIFAEMIHHLRSEAGPLPNDLYQTIILCFCLQKDQTGTAVALKALQMFFGNYPTEVTARAIVLQIARTGLLNEAGIAPPRRFNLKSETTQRRIESVTRGLGLLQQRRIEVLREQGIEYDELEGDAKLEETLVVLSQLLKYGYENKPVTGTRMVERSPEPARIAAKMMGVPEVQIWQDDHV